MARPSLKALAAHPKSFRAALLIDTDQGPKPFPECVNHWQQQDFVALDNGWQLAAGQKPFGEVISRGWLERPRGHAKTLDLAIMSSWCLFASRRQLSGIGAAGDQDQARLLRDAIGRLLHVNPWLSKLLEVQAYKVINRRTKSVLEIISSDAPTAYGLTPDFVVADEVVHWKKRDLWDSLLSSSAKRSTCMLVVITNAGIQDDWQFETREAICEDPNWHFSRLEEPCATWISADALAEQEKLLPSIAFRRLWLNQWTTGAGDALTPEDIAAAFGRISAHHQAFGGYEYVGGLDLGVSRDASALAILGVARGPVQHGALRLAECHLWAPGKNQKVDLQQVESAIADAHARFDLKRLNYDPWEARHMANRLQAGNLSVYQKQLGRLHQTSKVPMVEIPPTGQNLQRMATSLIEAFSDRRVQLFHDPDLRRDLEHLRIEERSYGYRLTSPRDRYGHGDLGNAFALAVLAATDYAGKRILRAGSMTDQGIYPDPISGIIAGMERGSRTARSHERMLEAERRDIARQIERRENPVDPCLLEMNQGFYFASRGRRGHLRP